MIEIFKWSILITLSIVCSLIILGFLIRLIEHKSNRYIISTFGKYGLITYGIIGTTIHEFSHFIVAKLFLHKILEVKWFSINIDRSGELGYVRHAFNRKNIYQRIGNFFIGTAPLIIGTFILIFFYRIFLKDSFNVILNHINLNSFLNLGESFSIFSFVNLLFSKILFILQSTFTLANFESVSFWIFLFIAISISTHMSLSKADLKNSFDGILFIFIAAFILTTAFFLLNIPFSNLSFYLVSFNVFLISFLSIGLIFSLISLFISFIFFRIKRVFK